MRIFAILLFISLSASCSSNGGGATNTPGNNNTGNTSGSGSNSGNTTGTITLTGPDTITIGTTLNTGFIGSSLAAAGQPDYIIVVDNASTVTFADPNLLTPVITNVNDAFVLVIFDEDSPLAGISMTIIKNGVQLDFACSTPVSVFIECGLNSINLDIASKTVSLNNVIVTNTNSSAILTLNGTLTW